MNKSHKINCACLELLWDIVRHCRHYPDEITIPRSYFNRLLALVGELAKLIKAEMNNETNKIT